MLIPRLKKPRERSRYWLFPLERNQGASGTRTTRRHKRTLTESRCWYTIQNRGENCSRDSTHRYRFSMKRKLETHRGISPIKFAMTNMGIEFIASPSQYPLSSFPSLPSSRLRTTDNVRENVSRFRTVISRDKLSPLWRSEIIFPRQRAARRRSFNPRVISMYHGRELF